MKKHKHHKKSMSNREFFGYVALSFVIAKSIDYLLKMLYSCG